MVKITMIENMVTIVMKNCDDDIGEYDQSWQVGGMRPKAKSGAVQTVVTLFSRMVMIMIMMAMVMMAMMMSMMTIMTKIVTQMLHTS